MEKLTSKDLLSIISKAPIYTSFERSSVEITAEEIECYCKSIYPRFRTDNIDFKKISEYLGNTDNRGWLFAGNTGSGKTTMSKIMFRFMDCVKYRVNGVDLEDNRTYAWKSVDAIKIADNVQKKGYAYITELANVMNLHINDIGTEVKKGSETVEILYMGTRINPIESLLILRGERKDMMTSATSNIPINSELFLKLYGDKVKSRICEICEYIEIKGIDYRINQK